MKIAYGSVPVLVGILVTGIALPALASPGNGESGAAAPQIRDPFVPFQPKIHEPAEPRTALERIELGSLSLKAVILGRSEPRALVEDDAGLGYTITLGTRVGLRRGRVVAIEPDRIVVEEETVDLYDQTRTHVVTLRLRTDERTSAR